MREPRLGDIIDDYCVKCKRIMNHAVVSLLNGEPAKVRCRTCHNDHDYRHEQAPPPKVDARKQALFNQVLAKVAPGSAATPVAAAEPFVAAAEPFVAAETFVEDAEDDGFSDEEPAEEIAAEEAPPAPAAVPKPAAKSAKAKPAARTAPAGKSKPKAKAANKGRK